MTSPRGLPAPGSQPRQGWLTKLLSALRREWPVLVNLATSRSAWSRPSWTRRNSSASVRGAAQENVR